MLSLLLNGIRNGNLDFGSVIAEILAVLVIIFLILPFMNGRTLLLRHFSVIRR